MSAPHILDPVALLEKGLSDASPGLMRTLLATVINALLSADADAVCGAEYGVASPERVNSRNGYRHRDLGHPGRHDRCRGAQPPPRLVLPRLAA